MTDLTIFIIIFQHFYRWREELSFNFDENEDKRRQSSKGGDVIQAEEATEEILSSESASCAGNGNACRKYWLQDIDRIIPEGNTKNSSSLNRRRRNTDNDNNVEENKVDGLGCGGETTSGRYKLRG